MLIQFSFKNFMSFRDEAVLDLSADIMSEHSKCVSGESILPVVAIYGANASGKSNVYKAFEYMTNYVVNSFNFGDDKNYDVIRPIPFLLDDESKDADTYFEVYFTIPSEKYYNYGFCVGKTGVTEEWLNYKEKSAKNYTRIFYRDENEIDLGSMLKTNRKNIEIALEKQVLIVSLGAKLKIDICKVVREWFLNNRFYDITNDKLEHNLPKEFVDNKKIRDDVIRYLSSFDDSIKDFEVIKLPSQENMIYTLHKIIGSNEMVKIPFALESAGIQRMVAMYSSLKTVMENGGVYFIDDLSARLHPLLVRSFVLTFINPDINVNHAQLVFTTHDTWQMSNHLLHKDEIWFTNKDKNGLSSLYSLADFDEEDDYENNYLAGKYGAIPSLKVIDINRK